MRLSMILLLLPLLFAPCAATAQETVFYKCTDAGGSVSIQNGTPCAPGMKQEIRRVGEVKTVPVPAREPEPEAPPSQPVYGDFVLVSGPNSQRAPAPEAAGLPAPPPLFQCSTWEGDTYLGDTATPEPRCAPLQVVGIDGGDSPAMGQACEVKEDQCTEVPAEQLCDAWYRRLDEAEFKSRYARDADRNQRQAIHDDIAAKIGASSCATEAPADASAAATGP